MPRKILVTGLSGFVGQQLQQHPQIATWHLLDNNRLELLDPASLAEMLQKDRPDAVIHLAGQTFVPEAFRAPQQTFEVNLLGTLNLLQALKQSGFCGSFLYVSSGDVYGQVDEEDLPICETLLPRPRNPYAVSKVAAELLCLQWSYLEPWRIMVARPFNHIGPGQRSDFVIPGVARQLARIRLGLQTPRIEVGDVDVTRDFLDVRDVLDAYFHLLDRGRNGEIYNVCSGMEYRVRDLIEQMVNIAGVEVELVQDPARLRPSEQRRVAGSSWKLQQQTGWKSGISITETLKSVLSDWEARVVEE
ncbi:GDP-mannose 4,6-dehydratase [Pseudomonas sp. Gutcm_11s]|uniref:GDP-mannose 4,6-dehydratase n=1 Tax=Pseudomonas sp. Gutcm_11s TaxID=3026088 RepID=UPI00235ED471|nr:GDP-mannose 4,6-dehydratase [Pseudomonas sp. Gutcm_11s]MDD0844998.1 GDP-mannose 4,6-dehydratase [Pseudomonas sp. Gutcm_11s]